MDTRKVTLIATVAIIALVAVGIGYAYTATTTSNDNDLTSQYISASLRDSDNEAAYTGTTKNIVFNTKTVDDSHILYGVYGATTDVQSFTNVSKIILTAVNSSSSTVNVDTVTMTISTNIFGSAGYDDTSLYTVKLTTEIDSTGKEWLGVKTSANTWTFVSSSGNQMIATSAGQTYGLVFGINGSGTAYPFTAPLITSDADFDIEFVASVSNVTLNTRQVSIVGTGSGTVTATVPDGATVAVSSGNTAVATVSNTAGAITILGVAPGNTTVEVTVTPTDGPVQKTIIVVSVTSS